jgi:hypothetical protein
MTRRPLGRLLVVAGLALALVSTSVCPNGLLLTQTDLGALATLSGGAMAIAAARALGAG